MVRHIHDIYTIDIRKKSTQLNIHAGRTHLDKHTKPTHAPLSDIYTRFLYWTYICAHIYEMHIYMRHMCTYIFCIRHAHIYVSYICAHIYEIFVVDMHKNPTQLIIYTAPTHLDTHTHKTYTRAVVRHVATHPRHVATTNTTNTQNQHTRRCVGSMCLDMWQHIQDMWQYIEPTQQRVCWFCVFV